MKKFIFVLVAVLVIIGSIFIYFTIKRQKTEILELNKKLENIQEENTPLNFIQNISLNSSIELIREKLGAPHKVQKLNNSKALIYHFNEFSLKVTTEDDETIESLTYLLKDQDKQIAIIPSLNNPNLYLGKNTFGDYLSYCPKITSESGAKQSTYYCDCYFGNPGYYREYRIGLYNGNILIDYQKDENDLIDNKYFQNVKINFISIAKDKEHLTGFWFEDFR